MFRTTLVMSILHKVVVDDRPHRSQIDWTPKKRKRLARTGTETMRGLLAAYLAFSIPGGVFSASGNEPARALPGKTTAKTTTKTV